LIRLSRAPQGLYTSLTMALEEYTYVFVIGTLFAMLDAYNNGASESRPVPVSVARPNTSLT